MKHYTFHQDEKVTIWQRTYFTVEAENEAEAKAIVEKNVGNDIDEIIGVNMGNTQILFETSEEMTIAENGGCATLEIYHDKKLLFSNGLDNEDK